MICALTGHRILGGDYDETALCYELEDLIKEGYDTFRCGMARGFDWEALQALIRLKQKYRIFIEACIPYAGHEESFPKREQKNYLEALGWCDRVRVMYENYCDGCFLARDRYMVEGADLVFAYCNKKTGGTAYTVNYAKKLQVAVRYFGDKGEESK